MGIDIPSNTDKSEWERFTKEKLIDGLKNKKYKHITIMTGAGVSVAAGIPDFRSPGTGLYDNLQEYELPSPEAIFDIGFFKKKPEAFYRLAQEFLDMAKFKATYVHHFCKMLQDKKMVRYYLTQNIDNLEEQAGFTQDDMIQAHGANFGAVCAKCNAENDRKTFEDKVTAGEVMYCEKKEGCEGPIKPEITFFGENLPEKFMDAFQNLQNVKTDLLIVIGTSLAVGPFNQCVNMVPEECPKVLINMQNTADSGFQFDNAETYPERLLLKGRSQEIIQEIAEACGWKDELMERNQKADEKHQEQMKANETLQKQMSKQTKASNEVDDLVKQLDELDVNKDDKDEANKENEQAKEPQELDQESKGTEADTDQTTDKADTDQTTDKADTNKDD